MGTKKPKFQYSEDAMGQALRAVNEGVSCSEASRLYNVPRSTLVYKKTGKSPVERRMGPECVLSSYHEQLLENWVKEMARKGFPVVKWDLMASVEKIVAEMNIKNPFRSGKPGKKWLALFLKRHPSISARVVEKLTARRASVSEANLRNWFHEIKTYLKDEAYFDILQDPNRVFNADEAAFMLCPKSEKVLGIRGQKNVYEITGNNEKESITVLVTANANGKVAPIMIVYPYIRLPPAIAKTVPDHWCIGKSEKGWMNSENFYEYIANTFHQWLEKSGIELPVILFIDGHVSHLTLHLSKFCAENGIILLSLYPNATHIIQPLDVAVFRPLKLGWQKIVHAWKMDNLYQHLTKYNFAPLLEKAIKEFIKSNTLVQGFRLCGLHPFNENAVDYSKCSNHSAAGASINNTPGSKTRETTKEPCMSHLKYLESKIEPNVLAQFVSLAQLSADNVWNDDPSYTQLYYVWRTFKNEAKKTSEKTPEQLSLNSTDESENINELEPEPVVLENTSESICSEIPSTSYQLHVTPTKQCETAPCTTKINNKGPTSSEMKRDKLSQAISPGTNGEGVPTPFKKILFWPGTPPKKKMSRINKPRLPSAVTSRKWQEYFEKKNREKEGKEREKLEKKLARENRKAAKRVTTKKRSLPSNSSESEKESLHYSESEDETLEELVQRYEHEETERNEEACDAQLQVGKWVLAELIAPKNKKRHYAGLITEKYEEEVTVKFLKKVSSKASTFLWPLNEDIADVSMESILKILPEPTMGRRGEMVFSVSFDGYDMF